MKKWWRRCRFFFEPLLADGSVLLLLDPMMLVRKGSAVGKLQSSALQQRVARWKGRRRRSPGADVKCLAAAVRHVGRLFGR